MISILKTKIVFDESSMIKYIILIHKVMTQHLTIIVCCNAILFNSPCLKHVTDFVQNLG